MVLLLVLLGACNGCQPKIPNPPDEPPVDTSPPPDSAEDTDSGGETGPPARCDREEVEPNSPPDDVETLEMENWACGLFATYIDYDSFRISPTQAGWIMIQVEAAARGSSANPQLIIEGGGESAQVLDGYLTTDPLLMFPADEPEPYTLTLGETNYLYGENYSWYMLTALSKPPVDWTGEEVEPNDVFTEAASFTLGDTVFGSISSPDDLDWFKITTPYEGEQTLTFNVTAFKEGSAANMNLVLYSADGTTILREETSGEIEYDRDPYFTKKFTGVQDLYLLARTDDGKGSRFHWYTLSITVSAE